MREAFLLRIDDEEYAAAMPGDPETVRLTSAGYLPLRARVASIGVHHRPAFPGTTVLLGGARYEVVDETAQGDAVVYTLRPWPADHIIREQVVYGAALIATVKEERRRLARRERGRRVLWPLYPFVGALPEPHQIRWCDRWGLDPVTATGVSGLAEAAAAAWFGGWLYPSALAVFMMGPLAVLFGTGVMRAFAALVAKEVTGSAFVSALWRVFAALRGAPAPDPTLLPMTRAAFWARLGLPDRHKREADGSLIVRGVLAHLTWTPGARLLGEEDHWWRVLSAEAVVERGRVVYTYALSPETIETMAPADVPAPAANLYQQTVLETVAGEWDDLRSSGFDLLVSLLPADVQERAAGKPAVLRRATVMSAVMILAGAVWMAFAPTAMNLMAAVVMAGDSAVRLLRVRDGRYAPSLFARWVARYLRPERVSYQAHRAAEWEVLTRVR